MLIKRTSPLSGKTHEMDINVTEAQLTHYFNGDSLIQDVFPDLTANEREFIMTGITEKEWDELFKATV